MAHPDAEGVGFGTKPRLRFESHATKRNALCNRERTHPGALRPLPPRSPPLQGEDFQRSLFMPRCATFDEGVRNRARSLGKAQARGRVRRRGRFQGRARLRFLDSSRYQPPGSCAKRLLRGIEVENRIDNLDFDTPVLGSGFRRFGGQQRFALSIAFRRDDLGTDPCLNQVVAHSLGTFLRKLQIVSLRADVIGMTMHFDGITFGTEQNACNPAQNFAVHR